jgi:hypothetical protein
VLKGRPDECACANHPDHEGQLVLVASGTVSVDNIGVRCRSFRMRRQASATPQPSASDDQVRYIHLTGGFFALVDATD